MEANNAQSELNAAVEQAIQRGFSAVLRLEPDGLDPIIVDGRRDVCSIVKKASKTPEADCTWRSSKETFFRVLEGGRALEGAYMSSRLHISGDMSVMARLQLETKS